VPSTIDARLGARDKGLNERIRSRAAGVNGSSSHMTGSSSCEVADDDQTKLALSFDSSPKSTRYKSDEADRRDEG
jgi:hypothetical protein